MRKCYESHILVSINSFIGTQPYYSSCILHGCLHITMAELSSCDKDPYDPQSLKYLQSALQKKKSANPCFRGGVWPLPEN